jgi:ABC-type branched-subunit amino acid transport system permease subunit
MEFLLVEILLGMLIIFSLTVSWVFFISRNGKLRIGMIAFFAAVAWCAAILSIRLLFFEGSSSPDFPSILAITLALVPVDAAVGYLAHYLCATYVVKKPH